VKAFSAGLTTALASRVRKLRKGVIIERLDETIVRFTDAQKAWEIDGEIYVPGRGVQLASIAMQANSTTTRWDMIVADGGLLAKNDLRSGIYDKARVRVFLYDEDETAPDRDNLLFGGSFGSIEVSEHGYTRIECVGPLDKSLAQISFNYGPICRRDLGDGSIRTPLGLPGCPVHIHPYETSPWVYATTVVGGSGYDLTIADPGNPDAVLGWYANGRIVVRDGYLKGKVYPIRTNESPTALKLFRPPLAALAPGTSLWIIPGCDKTLGPNGHLKFNANAYQFDAEPYMPSEEAVTAPAIPPGSRESGLMLAYGGDNQSDDPLIIDADGRTVYTQATSLNNTFTAYAITQTVERKTYLEVLIEQFGEETPQAPISIGVRAVDPAQAAVDWVQRWAAITLDPAMDDDAYIYVNDMQTTPLVGAAIGGAPKRVMIAIDPDARKVWIGLDGAWLDGANPATGANPTATYTAERDDNRTAYRVEITLNRRAQRVVAAILEADLAYSAPAGFLPY
jgi:uncharacterized phage protein (TIGR02218 family)